MAEPLVVEAQKIFKLPFKGALDMCLADEVLMYLHTTLIGN